MPYGIKHVGGKWIVFNKETGRAMGRHQSKKKATAQLAALHIHVRHSAENDHAEGVALSQSSVSRSGTLGEGLDSPAEGGAVKPVAGRPEDEEPSIAEGWGGPDRRSGKYL